MQYLSFEFDNEKDMRDIIKRLWENHGVTGELAVRPLSNSRWRLEVASEKELRDSTLEKFSAFRVEGD